KQLYRMGCTASKSTNVVVVPMPGKPKENVDPKQPLKQKDADSLRGSQSSIGSCSTASRSDRENSAKSTRTADSGVGELEEHIITERSSEDEITKAKANERPSTPDLSIDGSPLKRRKSSKQRQMALNDINNNNPSSLQPLGIIERPQSRGGAMAFNVMLYPETGNVKRKPMKLMALEKKKRRAKRRTKEEIEDKIKQALERKKEHDHHVIEKATLSRKERQLREAKALDEFAQRLEQQES
ncbi:hypothetical protein QZH41_010644, partial [Actinostola sp. cb2023]